MKKDVTVFARFAISFDGVEGDTDADIAAKAAASAQDMVDEDVFRQSEGFLAAGAYDPCPAAADATEVTDVRIDESETYFDVDGDPISGPCVFEQSPTPGDEEAHEAHVRELEGELRALAESLEAALMPGGLCDYGETVARNALAAAKERLGL